MPDETNGLLLGFIIAGIAIVAAIIVFVKQNYEEILCLLDAMAAIPAGLAAMGIALLLLDSGVSSAFIVLCSVSTAIIAYITPSVLLGMKSGDIKFIRPKVFKQRSTAMQNHMESTQLTKPDRPRYADPTINPYFENEV